MTKTKQNLDLNKVKDLIVDNIEVLLEDLDIDYEFMSDNVFMRCPIHGGDKDKGLSISLKQKNWRCWTRSCHEDFGTDIFGFIRGVREDSTFSDTLRYVCQLYNIGNEYQSTSTKPKNKKSEFDEIVNIFSKKRKTVQSEYVRDVETLNNSFYFEKRGFLPDTLAHFEVQDCIDKNSKMWNRAIIPVTFEKKEIAYIARAVKNFIQPKYLFSTGFKKTEYLLIS